MLTAATKRQLPALIEGNSLRISAAKIEAIATSAEKHLRQHGVRPKSRPHCRLFVVVPCKNGDAQVLAMVRKGKAWDIFGTWQAEPAKKHRLRWWLRLCGVAADDALEAIEGPHHA